MLKNLVIGNCGSGKTSFSKKLSYTIEVPAVHLDHLYWLPNWKLRSSEDFDDLLLKELQKDKWILDGNYKRTMPKRMEYADTVIYLNYSRFTCVYRAIKRIFINFTQAEGCPSKIDILFIKYILFGFPNEGRTFIENLKNKNSHIHWVEFQNDKQAHQFLKELV